MKEYFGKYHGSVQAEWMLEGRKMRLLKDFKFEDPNHMLWVSPKNSEVDGASIPPAFWSIIGSPFSGKYRDASVIHDVACQQKKRTWEVVHLAFYYAMRASGVSIIQAKIMYAAVYHFGPRWPRIEMVDSEEAIDDIKYDRIKSIGTDTSDTAYFPDAIKYDFKRKSKRTSQVSKNIPPDNYSIKKSDFERLQKTIKENSQFDLDQIRSFK